MPPLVPPASPPRDARRDRIGREVLLVAPRFARDGGVWFDEEHGNWLRIPRYPLPSRWAVRSAQLLILFPSEYPLTPPIGFYLDRGLPLRGDYHDPYFIGFGAHGAPDLRGQHWYWYCLRILDHAWRASSDYRQSDNLVSYLAIVDDALARHD
jgi:hypothetical protein